MKNFENSIEFTIVECNTWRENIAQFDMSSVCITAKSGEQVTIDNEDFEKLIAEYQRRQAELERINK